MTRYGAVATLAIVLMAPTLHAADAEIYFLAFTPDPVRETGALSPEGCHAEAGAASGELALWSDGSTCHSSTRAQATFTSPAFNTGIVIAGAASIVAYYVHQPHEPLTASSHARYRLDEVRADGRSLPIAGGAAFQMIAGGGIRRGEVSFDLPTHAVAKGSRLRLSLHADFDDSRLLFGDAPLVAGPAGLKSFADAGISLTTAGTDPGARAPAARQPLVRANSFM